jgi:hypothetical protein
MVLTPTAGTDTDTLLSAPPSAARVTVPVTVPTSWAAAIPGRASARHSMSAPARRKWRGLRGADEVRRIPGILWLRRWVLLGLLRRVLESTTKM